MFPDIEEYCVFETFKAECAPDDIIMITHAQYGRMRAGKCIEEGLGNASHKPMASNNNKPYVTKSAKTMNINDILEKYILFIL